VKGFSLLHRMTVFVAFAALAAAASLMIERASPSGEVWEQDGYYRERAEKMRSGAFFHRRVGTAELSAPAAFCRECHPFPPHPGEGVAPPMLNHHARKVGCLVCHWAKVSGSRPELTWTAGGAGKGFLQLAGPATAGGEKARRYREQVVRSQRCFDRGPKCADCHRRDGMKKYVRAGTTPEQRARLEVLEEYYTLPPGAKWYFPHIR
jgi:hypothetical protein